MQVNVANIDCQCYLAERVEGPAGRAVVEGQVILKQYLTVKKRMHAIYRLSRGDFNGNASLVTTVPAGGTCPSPS